MTKAKRPLRVFLCHASGDKSAVRELYNRLTKDGFDAWLDKEKLIPGQDWKVEIPKAVKNSDVVIVCLSFQSVNKEGFVQKEIKLALDTADEKPEGTIFIIPARLENCEVPDRISRFHWVDLYSDDGYEWLIKALKIRADNLDITLNPSIFDTPKSNLLLEKEKSFFVFFINKKDADNIPKLNILPDIGMLKIDNQQLKFDGIMSTINFPFINQISINRKKLRWIELIVIIVSNIIIFSAFSYAIFYTAIMQEVPLWLKTLLVMLFFSLVIWSVIIRIVIQYNIKSIKIDYTDEFGLLHSAFFSDATLLGIGGLLGGTEKLYHSLNALMAYLSTYRA